LQRLSESNERTSSYPPYNISKDGNLFAIEIAVAGLSKEDIQIELANSVLSVSYDGPKSELINGEDKVVYQGIAQRAFKQQFTLSEDVVVQDAELINGLLTINLEKIIPDEKKPRMIKISTPKRISNK
jgi:molecular chaperone IbpA